jgi:hypothetical protein
MKQLLIFISVLCSVNISAQVNIGTIDPPHAAAVLDLSQKEASDPARGLLMPRVNLDALTSFRLPITATDTEEKAAGMIVYNLAENASVCPGLYVWDGSEWRRLQEACPLYIPPVTVEPLVCSSLVIPPVRFMAYNLGADPTLDTPKKQMEYLITQNSGTTDARVYGGLYQWGRARSDLAHGASTDGTYLRYSGATNHATSGTTDAPVDNLFYTTNLSPYDWRQNPDATLWGNGKGVSADGIYDKGGVFYSDQYYQNTDWTNPLNNSTLVPFTLHPSLKIFPKRENFLEKHLHRLLKLT